MTHDKPILRKDVAQQGGPSSWTESRYADVLGLVICLAAVRPTEHPGIPPLFSSPSVMEDSIPDEITRLFTRSEFREAMGFLFEQNDADLVTGIVYEPTGIGVDVAEGSLLALALLSDDAARRVVLYRPELEEMVRRIRADPEAARASLQPAPPGQT